MPRAPGTPRRPPAARNPSVCAYVAAFLLFRVHAFRDYRQLSRNRVPNAD